MIDTPGFLDTGRPEEDIKPEILRCIVECSPGPHAFVIVLKVERFTDHEKEVITKTCQYFSEEALKYTVIVFTHGDQLPEEMTIQEFVSQSEGLMDLMQKCSGRCHVIDNKYWTGGPQTEYRSNRFQVDELLNTVDKIVMENKGVHYTNEMLQAVETEIQQEEERIRQLSGGQCQEETRKKAKMAVYKKNVVKFAKIAGKGVLIAALIGGFEVVGLVALGVKGVNTIKKAVSKKKAETGTTVKGEDSAEKAAAKPKEAAPSKAKASAGFFSSFLKIFKTKNQTAGEEVTGGGNGEVGTLEEEEAEGETEEASGTDEALMTTEEVEETTEEVIMSAAGGTLEVVGAEGPSALSEEVDGGLATAITAAVEGLATEEATIELAEASAEGIQAVGAIAEVVAEAAQHCCVQ